MKQYTVLMITAMILAGCAAKVESGSGAQSTGYKQITQKEAMEMMAGDDGHIIVDVRTQDEYNSGHIPGAVCIPNEDIGTEKPAELPDTEQIILVYCRSGRRSKEASEKLAKIGYVNVYEFGGILEWTGEIVTEDTAALKIWTYEDMPVFLHYDRLWESGEYAESSDPELIRDLVDVLKELKPGELSRTVTEDFTDVLRFRFEDGSEVSIVFEDENWLTDGRRYHVDDLQKLRSLLGKMMDAEDSEG